MLHYSTCGRLGAAARPPCAASPPWVRHRRGGRSPPRRPPSARVRARDGRAPTGPTPLATRGHHRRRAPLPILSPLSPLPPQIHNRLHLPLFSSPLPYLQVVLSDGGADPSRRDANQAAAVGGGGGRSRASRSPRTCTPLVATRARPSSATSMPA
jgi:hypothetical protein